MKKMLVAILLLLPLLTGLGYHDAYDQGYGDGYRNKPARSKNPQYVMGWNYGDGVQKDERARAERPKKEQQSVLGSLGYKPDAQNEKIMAEEQVEAVVAAESSVMNSPPIQTPIAVGEEVGEQEPGGSDS